MRQITSATVYLPRSAREPVGSCRREVGYEWAEVAPGVARPVLREGTPWRVQIEGEWTPAPWLATSPHRAEVLVRLPHTECGWTWEVAP